MAAGAYYERAGSSIPARLPSGMLPLIPPNRGWLGGRSAMWRAPAGGAPDRRPGGRRPE